MSSKEKMAVPLCCYLLGFTFFYLFFKSLVISFFAGFTGIKLRKFYEDIKLKKQRRELKNQFKDVLYQMSSSFETGRNMYQALMESEKYISMIYGTDASMAVELRKMIYEIGNNRDSDERVIREFAYKTDIAEIESFSDAYSICKETGGNLEKSIRAASLTLRETMEIEKEIEKIMSQKVFEGRIVAMMPLCIILILNICSPGYLEVMYTTIAGRMIMIGTSIIYVIASYWMIKLTEV
ncbi:MAG: type II secretion system F family protein [Eubacterium sp.]|nr:type II secretion system F family protein [Eubacterium sp.]